MSRGRRTWPRSVTKSSIMDSGAQMNVCPETFLSELNIQLDTIFPLQARIEGASSEPITLIGGIIVEISGESDSGQVISTLQLMYVSKAVKQVYLSLDACVSLQVVPQDFPKIGSCPPTISNTWRPSMLPFPGSRVCQHSTPSAPTRESPSQA